MKRCHRDCEGWFACPPIVTGIKFLKICYDDTSNIRGFTFILSCRRVLPRYDRMFFSWRRQQWTTFQVLQRQYLAMRSQSYFTQPSSAKGGGSIPVTTRNLESLIRLAQARAKMELREHVTNFNEHEWNYFESMESFVRWRRMTPMMWFNCCRSLC